MCRLSHGIVCDVCYKCWRKSVYNYYDYFDYLLILFILCLYISFAAHEHCTLIVTTVNLQTHWFKASLILKGPLQFGPPLQLPG